MFAGPESNAFALYASASRGLENLRSIQVRYPDDPEPVSVAEMYKKILMTVEQRQPQLFKNGHTRWDKVYPSTEESRFEQSRNVFI